jgi:hypothetical protein
VCREMKCKMQNEGGGSVRPCYAHGLNSGV